MRQIGHRVKRFFGGTRILGKFTQSSSMRLLGLFFCFITTVSGLAQEKSYTIVFLNKKVSVEQLKEDTAQKLMDGHMANIRRLAKEGKLLAAGPFEGGGGMFIFNTTSEEEAQGWLITDPAVRAGRWTIEILPYTPRTGSVCPAAEPVEMVLYTFVRFTAVVQKYNASNYPILIRQHEAYMKHVVDPSEVVTEAIFGPNEGGILILRSELPADAFLNDPGVQQGLLDVQIKKLYVAKTSFCEE
jgi:uncharacterized protein YciI